MILSDSGLSRNGMLFCPDQLRLLSACCPLDVRLLSAFKADNKRTSSGQQADNKRVCQRLDRNRFQSDHDAKIHYIFDLCKKNINHLSPTGNKKSNK